MAAGMEVKSIQALVENEGTKMAKRNLP